ncbi:hypothetical protein CS0771_35660 [Catellatospora sp. IY07-71]|nr:hypothetical protein CS0771_35660 [Catellatospora sp. IY07-71]
MLPQPDGGCEHGRAMGAGEGGARTAVRVRVHPVGGSPHRAGTRRDTTWECMILAVDPRRQP